MKFLVYLALGSLLLSCRQNPAKHKSAGIIITYPCAVIVSSSDKKIDELKKTNSTDDYNTIVDDNVTYQYESTTFLDSVKLKQIYKRSAGTVTFKSADGQIFKMNLSHYYWGVIPFNGKSKPVDADMTDITDSYNSYMK